MTVQTIRPATAPAAKLPAQRVGQPPLSKAAAAGDSLEGRTQQLGRTLLEALPKHAKGGLSQTVYEQLLRLSTSDEKLKVELFRFVDVLPSLKTDEAVAQHLSEYLTQPGVKLPAGANGVLRALRRLPGGAALSAKAAHIGARTMSQRFIAGATIAEVARAVEKLRADRLCFTLDLLGESVISEAEAQSYQQKYLSLLEGMCDRAAKWREQAQIDQAPYSISGSADRFSALPKVNVSVKLSSLYARFDPMAADSTAEAVKARLRPIFQLALARGAQVHVDMEQYDYRDISRRIFEEILMEPEFRNWTDIGIVVQAYLKDSQAELRRLLEFAKRRGTPVWVRLVKGAYWDYETMLAAQRDLPVPVFAEKWQTDANYERLTELLIQNWQHLRPAIASHNVRSVAHAQAVAQSLGLPARTVEYQVLFGMGDPIGRSLAAQGERVRVYVPFGEPLPGMAYLVRRLLENTSNDSFVRQVEIDARAADALLRAPEAKSADVSPVVPAAKRSFENASCADFAQAVSQDRMREALGTVCANLGFAVPIVIAGARETSDELAEREDPSRRGRIASRVHYATVQQAVRAMDAASLTFPIWREVPVADRAALLRRAAAELDRRRYEISAWMVYEVGKPWRDADADVAEAIDFLNFYAAEAERLHAPRKRNVPGEWNDYDYEARGPVAVIAPWNFPLAILTGMAAAALAGGNTVVIKPAEQSSRVGYFLMEALEAAGVPKGVANFVPGLGESVGAALVSDPRTAVIAFTGSKAVGLHILREAADVKPGQREIKHVVAELGGKNAIIVDEDADLDEAVLGVVHSMIGFSGQKCSACSRVIVIGSAYAPFCERLAEVIKSLHIGPAEDPATQVGPVVDRDSRERVERYIGIGAREGKLLAQASPSAALLDAGHFVPAAVFVECPADGQLSQDEIFGPVLSVLKAATLDEALRIADDTPYALTGGLYSRSPANIARVRREFRVGNLYINRRITGAIVDRQPFGGGRMSGVGSKAGGPDYLQHFMIPRTITEQVMRRGFAPVES